MGNHCADVVYWLQSLTADVNAAIAGLKAAGATEIVVVDGHGSGSSTEPDVLESQLLAPARMITREAPFDTYMDSCDHSVDAIVAVAMHAGVGNQVGFLSHTYTSEDIDCRVNGTPFNESMILALGAARLPEFPGPYRFALTFQDEAQAQNAALAPGAELQPDGVTVQLRARDFEEGYRKSRRLIGLAGMAGRAAAMQAVLAAQPNAATLRLAVNDWLVDRWLNRLPSPPSGAAGKRRYWGAR